MSKNVHKHTPNNDSTKGFKSYLYEDMSQPDQQLYL